MPKDHHTGPELQKLIDRHWNNQNAIYRKIAKRGFQEFFDTLPNKEEAFFSKKYAEMAEKCACCSDEGNRSVTSISGKRKEVLIRTPGSGILQSVDKKHKNPFNEAFIDWAAKEALEANVTHFTAHSRCGAAKGSLVAWLGAEGKIGVPDNVTKEEEKQYLKQSQIDSFAKKWAKAVTTKMQKLDPKSAKKIRHEMLNNLSRPKEMNIARCLYLTDIDELDTSFTGLPQGFVLRTGEKDDLKDVLKSLNRLRSIAFDLTQGFGTKFKEAPQSQFVICCIARSPDRLAKLKADTETKVKTLKPEDTRKIRIDGFIRSSKN